MANVEDPTPRQPDASPPRERPVAESTEKPETPSGGRPPARRRALAWVAGAVLIGAGLILGWRYFVYAMGHESTDDAFIEAHVIPIIPRVAGQVSRLLITDNQKVNAGDLLLEIDPRDYEARLAQAQASLSSAMADCQVAQAEFEKERAQLASAEATAARARAAVEAAAAQAARGDADLKRNQELLQRKVISPQEFDSSKATAISADANLQAARKEVAATEAQAVQAQKQVDYTQAKIAAAAAEAARAEATVEQAKLELSYTKIHAPQAGQVTRRSVEQGAYVRVGQTLFSIVPEMPWVIANFKETQLTSMRPGQSVKIHIDAFPDRSYVGHVESLQAGSGARFSLLPPENAVGNYVKVVQRVPVKIVFDQHPDQMLGPGLSVVPVVKVRDYHTPAVALICLGLIEAVLLIGAVWFAAARASSRAPGDEPAADQKPLAQPAAGS